MLPSGVAGRLQVCFFSATLHSDPVVDLSHKICFQPTWVDLKVRVTTAPGSACLAAKATRCCFPAGASQGKDSVPDTVHHVVINVDPKENRQWTGITDVRLPGPSPFLL